MAEITNNYAPGSCVFQAGSTQNGDITITGPITQYVPEKRVDHPLGKFIPNKAKVQRIVDWIGANMAGQRTHKDLLLPLKAAMEVRPRAVASGVTREAFVEQYGEEVSEESWKKWIRGNRDTSYDAEELDSYIAEIQEILDEKE